MLQEFREQHLTWDKANRRIHESVKANASDAKGRKLVVQVLDKGVAADLTGAELLLYWEHRGNQKNGLDNFELVDAEKGIFELYFSTGMASNVGKLSANLHLIDTTGAVTSEPFVIEVFAGINDKAVEASNEYSALNAALIRVKTIESQEDERKQSEEARKEAESARENAESERESAEQIREESESTRQSNENTRKASETTREENEATRKQNESQRESAEQERETNESTRQSNEETRTSEYADFKFSMEGLEQEYADKADNLEQTYAPRLNAVTAQLAQKVGRGVKAGLEDLQSDVLSAIEGGEGTSFNLLSIPQDHSVSYRKTNFINDSTNLFDKDDPNIMVGQYITISGNIGNLASAMVTGYIPAIPGESYIMPRSSSFAASSFGEYYDEDMNRITNLSVELIGDYALFTVPSDLGIEWMRINSNHSLLDTLMIVRGDSYPNDYTPFYKTLDENFVLNERQKNEVKQITGETGTETSNVVEKNPLYRKIIAIEGDSIAAGSTTAGTLGGYGRIIAERNDMIYENNAVSGGTVAAEVYTQSGAARHWISRSIQNMRSDADYIILNGGNNDSSMGVPLGEVSSGYTTELDDTTFCGALESTAKQLIERYPDKKIGYVIPHRMNPSFESFHPKIKEILEKWGIPYLDLYTKTRPLNYIPYLKENYTTNGDGWHPTVEGYEKFYCDPIEAFMKSL